MVLKNISYAWQYKFYMLKHMMLIMYILYSHHYFTAVSPLCHRCVVFGRMLWSYAGPADNFLVIDEADEINASKKSKKKNKRKENGTEGDTGPSDPREAELIDMFHLGCTQTNNLLPSVSVIFE